MKQLHPAHQRRQQRKLRLRSRGRAPSAPSAPRTDDTLLSQRCKSELLSPYRRERTKKSLLSAQLTPRELEKMTEDAWQILEDCSFLISRLCTITKHLCFLLHYNKSICPRFLTNFQSVCRAASSRACTVCAGSSKELAEKKRRREYVL